MWFILVILLFLTTLGNAESVSSAKIAPFFERSFILKIWVFLRDVLNFSDFLDKSTSESCMLFMCVVFVWILSTFCILRFSDSSRFSVISACIS